MIIMSFAKKEVHEQMEVPRNGVPIRYYWWWDYLLNLYSFFTFFPYVLTFIISILVHKINGGPFSEQ